MVLSTQLDSDEAVDAVLSRLSKVISDAGGTVGEIERWGRKRLAYPIKRQNDGFYFRIPFEGEAAVARELDRVVRITDAVLRHLIVRRHEQAVPVGEG